jgi:N-acetylglucosaminyl-diphospho-decaprenol L-rhamnosyltransferase
MTHSTPDLSIIIVNYNTCDLLEACLASVYVDLGQGSASVAAEVIVVDNASQDGSMAMVRRMFPQAILIESEVNLGYGGGANLGLMVARGRYLLLLNSDTVVLDSALRYLVEFMAVHSDAGACGPRLLDADGSVQRSAFRFPNLAQVALDLFPIFPRLTDTALNGRYAQDSADNEAPFAVDFTLGAAFVVSREVYAQTGGFDEDFFMYAEEVDWAMRIHAAGYNFYSVPAACIIHYAGQSVKQAPGRMYYELFRSRALLYRKHYSPVFQLAARLLTRTAMVQHALADWWRNRRGKLSNSELHRSWQVYGKIFRL